MGFQVGMVALWETLLYISAIKTDVNGFKNTVHIQKKLTCGAMI
jgi:hypothetical protein